VTVRRPARGRPAAFTGKNKARSFTLTMTDAGYDAAAAGAAAAGMSRNDYIESVLLAAHAAAAPTAARARCPHTWHDGHDRRCGRVAGHTGPHAWGKWKDDRPAEAPGT
jgi:hypothetical protein